MRNEKQRIGVVQMTRTNNPVLDAETLAEIRSREPLSKRNRKNYESIERGEKDGRTESNCEPEDWNNCI